MTPTSPITSACDAAIEASVARGEDVAIADLIDLESEYLESYANAMAALTPLDIDETSSLDYFRFAGDVDYPVLNGYGNLVAAWGASVPVSLNTRVDAIDWSGTLCSCRNQSRHPGWQDRVMHGIDRRARRLGY